MVEAAVLANGLTYASLPVPTKTALGKSSSSAIKLFTTEAEWYRPNPTFGLHTTPGINYVNAAQLPASDFVIRWSMGWIAKEGRKGSSIMTADSWERYLAEPTPTYRATLIPYSLVVTFSNNPIMVAPTADPTSGEGPSGITPQQLERALATARVENAGFRHLGPDASPSFTDLTSGPRAGGDQNPAVNMHSQMVNDRPHLPPAQLQDLSALQQEPTVYQKLCKKCSWKSLASLDPRAYVGAVADYELHVKENHSDPKETGEFSTNNKDCEEFERATQMREVTCVKDDCNLNLCEARYWREPLSWINCQLNLPAEQRPICSVGDYEPYGLEINNKALIRGLHSRTNKNTTKLKYYSNSNLKVIPSQQENLIAFDKSNSGQLLTTKEWKELNSVNEAIQSSHNYMEIMRSIHPLDSGPRILHKVMFEKFVAGGTDAKQLEEFFNSVTWELANRAAKSQLPYRHAELLLKWDQSFRGSFKSQASMKSAGNLEKQIVDTVKRTIKQLHDKSITKKPRVAHNWCKKFNTMAGCSNPESDSGCEDSDGKILKHGCNATMNDGKNCNSADHNRMNHTE